MNAIRQFLGRIRRTGRRRRGFVTTVAMGRTRVFGAWDVGDDTFIFERGVGARLKERPSVLIVGKDDLRRGARGYVFTMTTGNHSVGAFPLLDGRFWNLSHLPRDRRSETLARAILCANVVNGTIETSQRDLPAEKLYAADEWLQRTVGFAMDAIVMGDRNEETLEHYRLLGQEWRMKPLAWTEAEMKTALLGSRKAIASKIVYCHSARGVHFLPFAEFRRFTSLAESDPAEYVRGLRELVAVYEGQACSFCRLPKYRGHHEIELFGLSRGVAFERIVPELERLMESVALGRLGQLGVIQKAQEILALYESLLTRPELADETSKVFVETLYMHITGEIYAVAGEGLTPAFDDRRTALPGATFVNGRAVLHPGADDRTEVLVDCLRDAMSKDETVLYANVYEIREDETTPIGRGRTREIVFRTDRRPLEKSLIEKLMSSAKRDYGGYMLSRIGALRALGISLSRNYRLLRRLPRAGRHPVDFYVRERCEGEPMDSIPANYFRSAGDSSAEARDVVLALATLMGDAAAQNMAMKKYDPVTQSPLYGVGKEIYDFGFDIVRRHVMPKGVATCSVRGALGWPNLSCDDANLRALDDFYLTHFARALEDYRRRHGVPADELAARFLDGFEYRTHALAWQLSVMRDRFEAFGPPLPRSYDFGRKWAFLMWALERQERELPELRRLFLGKVAGA